MTQSSMHLPPLRQGRRARHTEAVGTAARASPSPPLTQGHSAEPPWHRGGRAGFRFPCLLGAQGDCCLPARPRGQAFLASCPPKHLPISSVHHRAPVMPGRQGNVSAPRGRNARGPRRGSPGVSALGLVDQGPSDPPGGLQSVSGAAIVRDRACGAAPPVSLCVQWAACPLKAIQAAVAQGPLLALPEATRPQQAVQRAWLTEPRDLFGEAKLLEPADLWPRTPPGLWVSFGTQPRCHLVCWGLAALH